MTRFGIIGGGLMGHGIAIAMAQAGMSVSVYDPDPHTLATLGERVLQSLARSGTASDEAVKVNDRITAVTSLEEAARRSDVVAEAVPERLEIKHQVLASLEAEISPRTPVWSNTSVLPLTEVARQMTHPERLVGVHWWNPPYVIPLVEVAPAAETEARYVDEACSLSSRAC